MFVSCKDQTPQPGTKAPVVSFDMDAIRKRGKLIAVTDFNTTDYFIYKGEPMGFNYELLKSFSDYAGVDLEIITENNLDRVVGMLNSGEADLLAIGMTVTSSRMKEIGFTKPIGMTRQVLVQRKPLYWRSMTVEEVDKRLVRNQLALARKTIYVQKGTAHKERIATLAAEIGDSIKVVEVPYDAETLIRHVATGEIDYSVCDENIAQVNATYYPGIDVGTPVSFPQKLAWAVRKNNSDKLLEELNRWITVFKLSGSYELLHAKYFNNIWSSIIIKSDLFTLSSGKVSRYDDLIKEYSAKINWDWRLLASLICQESRFEPNVESEAGAYGLMQVMPETARFFGADIMGSPRSNIKAGIQYLTWLHTIFDTRVTDKNERLRFILAAYNAGPGHVLDAMNLASKNGMDPQKWDGSVALWLMKKSQPRYYNDDVVKNGYFSAGQSITYVTEILDRYEHYKNFIPVGN